MDVSTGTYFIEKVPISTLCMKDNTSQNPYSKVFNHHKFEDVANENINVEGMNILNLIRFENYYCHIDSKLRGFLKINIDNYSTLSRTLKVSSNTVSRIVNQEGYWVNIQTLLLLAKLINITNKKVFESVTSIKTKNSFPINFSAENLISCSLFRIIGHILGDGGIHVIKKEGKYRVFYVNNEKILLNSFEADIKFLFGDVAIYSRERFLHGDEIWLPTTLGLMFYGLMQYEILGRKRIPNFIFTIKDEKLLGSILQALYDDEGYLYPKKNMIVISQKSKELVNEIRDVVKMMGIVPNQLLIHKPKDRTLMHYFSITGKENIIKFSEKIGFLHPVKKAKLEILVKKYR